MIFYYYTSVFYLCLCIIYTTALPKELSNYRYDKLSRFEKTQISKIFFNLFNSNRGIFVDQINYLKDKNGEESDLYKIATKAYKMMLTKSLKKRVRDVLLEMKTINVHMYKSFPGIIDDENTKLNVCTRKKNKKIERKKAIVKVLLNEYRKTKKENLIQKLQRHAREVNDDTYIVCEAVTDYQEYNPGPFIYEEVLPDNIDDALNETVDEYMNFSFDPNNEEKLKIGRPNTFTIVTIPVILVLLVLSIMVLWMLRPTGLLAAPYFGLGKKKTKKGNSNKFHFPDSFPDCFPTTPERHSECKIK